MFGLSAPLALGNVVEQLARVQPYLVGNVHHQVVALVPVAVLKRGDAGGQSLASRQAAAGRGGAGPLTYLLMLSLSSTLRFLGSWL